MWTSHVAYGRRCKPHSGGRRRSQWAARQKTNTHKVDLPDLTDRCHSNGCVRSWMALARESGKAHLLVRGFIAMTTEIARARGRAVLCGAAASIELVVFGASAQAQTPVRLPDLTGYDC